MPQNSEGHSLRSDDILKLATEIVAAYVSNNPIPASEVPAMIKSVHSTLGGLGGVAQASPGSCGSLAELGIAQVAREVLVGHRVRSRLVAGGVG